MQTYYYHMYGLTIASPIQFPEACEISSPEQVDATFTFCPPPDWVLEEYAAGKYASITENIMWFRLEDELLIYVANGSEVRIHLLCPEIEENRMRSYILSGALTFLLFQHHFLLIHGSAIVSNEKVYLISGPSGSGKSTTALELLKQDSIQFASDDICAVQNIEGQSILHPGPPWQKVCADVQARTPEHTYVHLQEVGDKFGRRLTHGYITSPMPIGGMFIISKKNCNELSIAELSGIEKLHALTHNLFRGELLHVIGITPQRMVQLLETVNHFPIYEISRPDGKDTINEIISLITSRI